MNRRIFISLVAGLVLAAGIGVIAASGDSPYDAATGAPKLAPVSDQLSVDAAKQMEGLPSTTQVVECAPGLAKLPAGFIPSRSAGFVASHPGFGVLSDGHCVMDTSRPGKVVEPHNLDP
ncbi:MAG: hypothetical protein V4515_09140 [Chloroflexota bacterium]